MKVFFSLDALNFIVSLKYPSKTSFPAFVEKRKFHFFDKRLPGQIQNTNTWVKVLKDWLMTRNANKDSLSYLAVELVTLLQGFYVGARKKDGTEYEPNCLNVIPQLSGGGGGGFVTRH